MRIFYAAVDFLALFTRTANSASLGSECDVLAAHPYDIGNTGNGVRIDDIDPVRRHINWNKVVW